MSVLNVGFRLASFFPISSLLSLPDASDETSHYLWDSIRAFIPFNRYRIPRLWSIPPRQLLHFQYYNSIVFQSSQHVSASFFGSNIAWDQVHRERHWKKQKGCQRRTDFRYEKSTLEALPFGKVSLQQTQVCFPLVTNDFAAGKTADRDNHGGFFWFLSWLHVGGRIGYELNCCDGFQPHKNASNATSHK